MPAPTARPLTGFELWLMTRITEYAARGYGADLKRLRTVATEEEILYGDIEEIVSRHPLVARPGRHRSRRAQPLRRSAKLYREYKAWTVVSAGVAVS